MKFILEINLDNAAFDDGKTAEVSRILKNLSNFRQFGKLAPGDGGKLMDVNGNSVGEWSIEE